MWREFMYKILGVEPRACLVCEVLREQLAISEKERRELLQRALAPPSIPTEPEIQEEFKPIMPKFIPWNVRRQMLEADDRKAAQLMKEKAKEIAELEKELGVAAEAKQQEG